MSQLFEKQLFTGEKLAFQSEMILTFSLIARLFFGCAYGLIFIWSSELYPTPVRNIGLGVSSMCGKIGLLGVPFILQSGVVAQVFRTLPVSFLKAF